jgi:hypothetical protein
MAAWGKGPFLHDKKYAVKIPAIANEIRPL